MILGVLYMTSPQSSVIVGMYLRMFADEDMYVNTYISKAPTIAELCGEVLYKTRKIIIITPQYAFKR